tara:strand:+ start:234 stop:935 length:702 start_codon:yes stop_codon:yes gene_type:complete
LLNHNHIKNVFFFVIFVFFINTSLSYAQEITVADFNNIQIKKNSNIPLGWILKIWRGKPDLKLIKEKENKIYRLRSKASAISIYKEIKLDVRKSPILEWTWKATKIPEKGSAKHYSRDDQAIGIYVVFPRFPSMLNSRLIAYIWDSNVPKGKILRSRKQLMVHYIVVRSGKKDLRKWITERRNVLEDYKKIFSSSPPKIGGISIMIDSDDTNDSAESFIKKITFKGLSPKKGG